MAPMSETSASRFGQWLTARRKVLFGLAGFAALAVARESERVTLAANGQALILGQGNSATLTTALAATLPSATPALRVDASGGPALVGTAGAGAPNSAGDVGVTGVGGTGSSGVCAANGGHGVAGHGGDAGTSADPGCPASGGAGVLGQGGGAPGGNDGPGVRGESSYGFGVDGFSSHGAGVNGYSLGGAGSVGQTLGANRSPGVMGNSDNGPGVWGQSRSNYALYGISNQGAGVVGNSAAGAGAWGNSATNYGLYGTSDSNVGVFGSSRSGVGVFGTSGSGVAGQFNGPVVVNGSFIATGTKSTVVPGPRGKHRLLYCVESPESWFEDFGEASLVRGVAEVELDPAFGSAIESGSYQVFLTPYGNSNGLFVSARTASGFQVREQRGGTGTLRFGYRVVGRRAGVVAHRFAEVELPAAAPGAVADPAELPARRAV